MDLHYHLDAHMPASGVAVVPDSGKEGAKWTKTPTEAKGDTINKEES